MPRTPDEFPGERIEESGTLYISGSIFPSQIGELQYVSGSSATAGISTGFAFMQDDGVAFIRSGNINASDHERLRQLVHLSDEDGPRGSLFPSGYVRDTGPWPFPTASIWWTDSSRTIKYMQQTVVRNAQKLITTSSWQLFLVDGVTVTDSFTDVITYSGVFETSRTRTQP